MFCCLREGNDLTDVERRHHNQIRISYISSKSIWYYADMNTDSSPGTAGEAGENVQPLRIAATQKNAADLLLARWAFEEFVAARQPETRDTNGP